MAKITQWRPTRTGIILTVAIIIVAALVGGGLYLLKQQGQQARREDAVKVAEQKLKDESNQGVALNQGESGTNKDQSQSGTSGQSSTGQSQGAQNQQGANEGTATSGATQAAGGSASQLPQTGPADISAVFAIAALTFTVAAYIQSRRQLQ